MDKYEIDFSNFENIYSYIIKCLNKECQTNILEYLIQKNIDLNVLFDYLEKNNVSINYNRTVENLLELKQEEIVKKHFNYFLKNNNNLLEFKQLVKDINITEINNCINNNHNLIIEEVSNLSIKELNEEKLYHFFDELIKELLEKENCTYDKIEFIGQGSSNKVFGIGNKVIKVGMPKEQLKMKNNKLFLQPLYRKEIYSKFNNEILFCIEITERVDTKNINEDDVYYIYKTLRDEGLIWMDHLEDNVGRLLKDNKIYFEGIDYVDSESTNYIGDNVSILPKGSLVLIDNDCIYDEKEFFKNCDYRLYEHCNKYEARYREEKRNEEKSRGVA